MDLSTREGEVRRGDSVRTDRHPRGGGGGERDLTPSNSGVGYLLQRFCHARVRAPEPSVTEGGAKKGKGSESFRGLIPDVCGQKDMCVGEPSGTHPDTPASTHSFRP